jgi:hypothetical protein
MKIIPKQKQFNIAIKRRKIGNIKTLASDPEVNPDLDNWAISIAIGDWEVFKILIDSGRVNPFKEEQYKSNLINSIAVKDNRVFDYLKNNSKFEENIYECLSNIEKTSTELFKSIYNIKNYKFKITDEEFKSLLRKSYREKNSKIFNFLLKENPEKEVKIIQKNISSVASLDFLKIMINEKRIITNVDIVKTLEDLIKKGRVDYIKTIMYSGIEYDKLKFLEILYLASVYNFPLNNSNNFLFEIMNDFLNTSSIEFCKTIKLNHEPLYNFYEERIEKKIIENKVIGF